MAMIAPAKVRENRVKAVNALLTTTEPQGCGELYNEETGCYCALGIMCKAIGLELDDGNYVAIDEAFGFPTDGADIVWRMNDMKEMSFVAIGQSLASMWDINL